MDYFTEEKLWPKHSYLIRIRMTHIVKSEMDTDPNFVPGIRNPDRAYKKKLAGFRVTDLKPGEPV